MRRSAPGSILQEDQRSVSSASDAYDDWQGLGERAGWWRRPTAVAEQRSAAQSTEKTVH